MMTSVITDIPLNELSSVVASYGLKPYAADQIISWLYKRRVSSFDDMTNLSKVAREILKKNFMIDALSVERVQEAADGTRKFLYCAHDGATVECVLIPSGDGRTTVCLSTQVGCAFRCEFCRTAMMGFRRNLSQGEILGQLILIMRNSDIEVTNVVLMGMGEPLANIDAVSNAIRTICDDRAFGLSKRRVTLSTVGLIPELESFTGEFGVKIAISLNATTDEVRNKIMPINRRYPISTIMEFCRGYSKRSRYRITFEYVMIRGINDTKEDAKRLVKLLSGVRAKVNLIPFNSFEGSEYKAPFPETIEWWSEFLYEKGIQTNIRASRGQEIMAACGQLATTWLKNR